MGHGVLVPSIVIQKISKLQRSHLSATGHHLQVHERRVCILSVTDFSSANREGTRLAMLRFVGALFGSEVVSVDDVATTIAAPLRGVDPVLLDRSDAAPAKVRVSA